jgi:hypothetical protein
MCRPLVNPCLHVLLPCLAYTSRLYAELALFFSTPQSDPFGPNLNTPLDPNPTLSTLLVPT